MPDHIHFNDKDGNIRKKIRIKWWENAQEMTCKSLSVIQIESLPEQKVGLETLNYYKESDKKVFFGHYWLSGRPSAIKDNICCLRLQCGKRRIACSLQVQR